MAIKHLTNRAHYEKYKRLAKESGVTLKRTTQFMGISNVPCNHWIIGATYEYLTPPCGKCWRCKYEEDHLLNTVPLSQWDMQVAAFQVYHQHRVVNSLAEGVSMYKHLVIYEILGATPVFKEDNDGLD